MFSYSCFIFHNFKENFDFGRSINKYNFLSISTTFLQNYADKVPLFSQCEVNMIKMMIEVYSNFQSNFRSYFDVGENFNDLLITSPPCPSNTANNETPVPFIFSLMTNLSSI